jgi:hypothetical protein
MRAIETRYKGYRFRSRLEARWAVFFDKVGLEWVYEPEGFELGDGVRYLPDFRIVDWGTYIEIKPALPSLEELHKLFLLAREIRGDQRPAPTQVMLCGTPAMPQITLTDNTLSVGGGYVALTTSGLADRGLPFVTIESFAMTAGGANLDIWPMYFERLAEATLTPTSVTGSQPNLMALSLFHGVVRRYYVGEGVQYNAPNLLRAYEAARSARFEHGETPEVAKRKPKR